MALSPLARREPDPWLGSLDPGTLGQSYSTSLLCVHPGCHRSIPAFHLKLAAPLLSFRVARKNALDPPLPSPAPLSSPTSPARHRRGCCKAPRRHSARPACGTRRHSAFMGRRYARRRVAPPHPLPAPGVPVFLPPYVVWHMADTVTPTRRHVVSKILMFICKCFKVV